MIPDKPLYGSPCNGCGLCCIMEQFPLSVAAFGPHDRCPALVETPDRFACGLISEPLRYFTAERATESSRLIGEALGIGRYCDAVETLADELIEAVMEAAK